MEFAMLGRKDIYIIYTSNARKAHERFEILVRMLRRILLLLFHTNTVSNASLFEVLQHFEDLVMSKVQHLVAALPQLTSKDRLCYIYCVSLFTSLLCLMNASVTTSSMGAALLYQATF